MIRTGSVKRKWWSSGSTLKYLKMELDQNRSMWSCLARQPAVEYLRSSRAIPSYLLVHVGWGSVDRILPPR